MTEDEAQIKKWRNERRNHCQFATQAEYDVAHKELGELHEMLTKKEISDDMAVSCLVVAYNYGEAGAERVVRRWHEQDNKSREASEICG